MSVKDELIEKLNTKVDLLKQKKEEEEAKIDRLRSEATDREASKNLKEEGLDTVAGLKDRINQANNYIENLKSTTSDNIDEVKNKIDNFLS